MILYFFSVCVCMCVRVRTRARRQTHTYIHKHSYHLGAHSLFETLTKVNLWNTGPFAACSLDEIVPKECVSQML